MGNPYAKGSSRRRNRQTGPNIPEPTAPAVSVARGASLARPGKFMPDELEPPADEPRVYPDMPETDTWNALQWAFICWMATPPEARDPITMGLFAAEYGVTDRTLRNWKNLSGFWPSVRNLAKTNLERDLPEIYFALASQAKTGSFQHIKLALELVGDYTEHYDFTSAGKPFQVETFDYNNAIAAITAGSGADSETSGETQVSGNGPPMG